MADVIDLQNPESWGTIAAAIVAAFAGTYKQDNAKDVVASGILSARGGIVGLALRLASEIGVRTGQALVDMEEPVLPVLAGFIAPMVANMLGGDVDASAFANRANTEGRNAAASALVETFLTRLAGDNVGIAEPGDEGAKRVATAGLQAALEGWFMAAVPELLSDLMPAEWLHFTAFSHLPEEIISALGIGRLVRRALTPLVNATATIPMTWATNKTYRPKLLAESTALRQFLRGSWDWVDAEEELARMGYTSERMDALLNELSKFMSASECWRLMRAGQLSRADAIQHLRDSGDTQDLATARITLEQIAEITAFETAMADAAVTAYAERRIDDAILGQYTAGTTIDEQHGAQLRELAAAKRQLRTKGLTPAEALACVEAGILNVIDYRNALIRDGYDDDSVTALELLARTKLDASKTAAEHKQVLADQKAADAKTKADAAAAKKAQIDAARALKQQGSISELEHAVVIGTIPIARLEQVLNQEFTPDTVGIYVADVEAKRQTYVEAQKKAADAATRAANKGLNVAQLSQAVYDNVIDVNTFAAGLAAKGITGDDAAILTATVRARKTDLDAARAKRAEADRKASQKKISLGNLETLVLLGHRTMADYDALLASLGYDDASRAAMDDLLQSKISAQAQGTTLRAELLKTAPAKALTLMQMRNAVIRGDQTIDQFAQAVLKAGYTADAQAVLVDELRTDVAAADAARLRRSQGDTTGGPIVIPLATVQKAARLGTITPDAYEARLTAGGYSADDIALEMDLLTAEIAKSAGAKQTQAGAPTPTTGKGLTLTALAAAVKRGDATIDDYRAAAASAGLSSDAIDTLVGELHDALVVKQDAKSAHDNIAAAFAQAGISLTDLEQQVRVGALTIAALEAQIQTFGYTAADAQLVGSLLEGELAGASATTAA